MRSSSSRARASPLSVALSPSPSSRWVYLAHTYPYTYSDLQRELRLLEDDPRYKSTYRKYGQMFELYRHKAWYFEFVFMLEKLIMTSGLLVLEDGFVR